MSLPKPKVLRFPKYSSSAPEAEAERRPRERRGSSLARAPAARGEPRGLTPAPGAEQRPPRGGSRPRAGTPEPGTSSEDQRLVSRQLSVPVAGGRDDESDISPALQELNSYLDGFKK